MKTLNSWITLGIVALLLTALAAGAFAYDPNWRRSDADNYSFTGLNERYLWGGTTWIDNDYWDSNEGVDCSGYVTKVWAIPNYTATTQDDGHPYNTSHYYYGTCPYSIFVDRNVGGYMTAWVYQQAEGGPSDHMGLFVYQNGDGTWACREAKGSAYGVVVTNKSISTLISYNYKRCDRKDWGAAVADIILDNTSGSFSASASWLTGTSSTDKYGTNYRYRSTAATSDQAVWTPNITASGSWTVYAWWPAGTNRSSYSAYLVYYSGGSTNIYVNQQINGGKWNTLTTQTFGTGTGYPTKKSCWATTGFVVMADAVKWHKN